MNKHYACTDFHGMYNLWTLIRDCCDDTDEIYFLGDAADRGSDGIKIIFELLKDKRVHYIKGNHEDMLVKSMDIYDYNSPAVWFQNGGSPTFDALMNLGQDKCTQLVNTLKRLPHKIDYTNTKGQIIHLTHAGYTPCNEPSDFKLRMNNLLWDRNHNFDIWFEHENEYCVFGHTPVFVLPYFGVPITKEQDKEELIVIFSNGHKIDLDLNSFYTNKVALFDLDSFEVKYFKI